MTQKLAKFTHMVAKSFFLRKLKKRRICSATAVAALGIHSSLVMAQAPKGVPPTIKHTVEGQPWDDRPPELDSDYPVFPGQTRAPFQKTVDVDVAVIAENLDWPWAVAQLPKGRFLITEKPGRFRILNKDGSSLHTISANLPPIYSIGQSGLLDVVLDPRFAVTRRIFFTYMRDLDASNTAITVASAKLDADRGELSNVRTLFQATSFTKGAVANAGSRIAIDPKDSTLFVIIGDRNHGTPIPMQSQQLDNYLGKVIHITMDGKPALDNPGFGLQEIWSYGHRSPEGLAFAPNGQLWETEHGPRGGDELNLIQKGKNYGWPVITHGINYSGEKIGAGIVEKEGMEQPRYYWDPVIAPSGLAFYVGNLFPQWENSALVGGLRSQALFRVELGKDNKVVNEEALLIDVDKRIRDVRVFPDGAAYVLTDGAGGQLLKLTPRAKGLSAKSRPNTSVPAGGRPVPSVPAPTATAVNTGPIDGRTLVQRTCEHCHALNVITAKKMDRANWLRTVNDMVARGAVASPPEIDAIVDYLTKTSGTQ